MIHESFQPYPVRCFPTDSLPVEPALQHREPVVRRKYLRVMSRSLPGISTSANAFVRPKGLCVFG